MNEIKTIFGKEMARIFKDKKMVFSVFLLPVIIMIGIMVLVGKLSENVMADIEQHQATVFVKNESEGFRTYIDTQEVNMTIKELVDESKQTKVEDEIREGKTQLLIEFPAQFDEMIANYKEGDQVPQVKTFFNPSEDYSWEAMEIMDALLEQYRQTLLGKRVGNLETIEVFTVNSDNEQMIIQDEKKANAQALATMLPYFITLLLFAGAMGIGIDMIAGEKERGTMASLLMTPIKRSSIALGKVFALMSLSGLSAAISIAAMAVCMPMMSSGMGGDSGMKISLDVTQVLQIGVLIVAIAFLYSTMIALISVFAKDVKEGSSYVMPAYMLVMVLGIMTMFRTGSPAPRAFLVPIYNTAIVLGGILTNDVTWPQYLLTLGMTVGISVVLIGFIVKAFKSEKVMSA